MRCATVSACVPGPDPRLHAGRRARPDDRCSHLLPNFLHCMPGLELHEEVEEHAEHDQDDDQPADRVTQHQRDGAGRQKDDDQRIGKQVEKLKRAAKRDSLTRLFGPWSRKRCFASSEVSPAGVAWRTSSRSRSGSQNRSNGWSRFALLRRSCDSCMVDGTLASSGD